MKKARTSNKLPQELVPKFIDEMRRYYPIAEARKISYVDAARAIGIAIGFKQLASSKLTTYAKADGKPYTWTEKGSRVPGANGVPKGHNRTRALAAYVAALYDKLGEPRPEGLNAIMRSAPMPSEASADETPTEPNGEPEQLF